MELVELTSLRGALVGLPGVNGLSTEQRKRLTIAVELVANPSIIFMDEPTSGLDARAAAIVMRAVRNTVDTGRTVVCTIHQPSIDIFEAFDEVNCSKDDKIIICRSIGCLSYEHLHVTLEIVQLFLMKRGGEEIYVGPLGHNSCHLISYFEVSLSTDLLNKTSRYQLMACMITLFGAPNVGNTRSEENQGWLQPCNLDVRSDHPSSRRCPGG